MQPGRSIGNTASLGYPDNRQGQNTGPNGDDDADDYREELSIEDYPSKAIAAGHGCCPTGEGGKHTPSSMLRAQEYEVDRCRVYPVVRSTGAFRA